LKSIEILSVVFLLNLVCAQETEVDGKLKVTGEIDVSGNRVTNIGAPEENTDAVNVNYLESKTLRLINNMTPNQFIQGNKGIVVFYEYEIPENSISKLIRVELEAEGDGGNFYPELLIGLSEEGIESQGVKLMGSKTLWGGSTSNWNNTYNPQVLWNVILPEEWKNKKLYLKLQANTELSEYYRRGGGQIRSIFLWGF